MTVRNENWIGNDRNFRSGPSRWLKTAKKFNNMEYHPSSDRVAFCATGTNEGIGGFVMARPYQRSIFDELDDLREYVNSMFQQAFPPADLPMLPAGESQRMPAPFRHEMKVDVIEHDDEVVVTADMIPGIEKKDISLELINSHALKVSCERREETKEEKEGYYLHERRFGSLQRVIPLPSSVTYDGSKSTFKNGVLEVHLKKAKLEKKSKIMIE